MVDFDALIIVDDKLPSLNAMEVEQHEFDAQVKRRQALYSAIRTCRENGLVVTHPRSAGN